MSLHGYSVSVISLYFSDFFSVSKFIHTNYLIHDNTEIIGGSSDKFALLLKCRLLYGLQFS